MKPMDPRAALCKCERPILMKDQARPGHWVRRPCRKCLHCQWTAAKQSLARAEHEHATAPPGTKSVMLSLTIKPEDLEAALPDMGRANFRRFTKRIDALARQRLGAPLGVKVFGVPEFGDKHGRLHAHALLFAVPDKLTDGPLALHGKKLLTESKLLQLVTDAWTHGYVDVQPCDIGGIRYVYKYVTKGKQYLLQKRDEWARKAERMRALGIKLPKFETAFWIHHPRGRQGGLGRQSAEAIATAAAAAKHPAIAQHDAPRAIRVGRRLSLLSRYERRIIRDQLHLNDEASKQARAAANPDNAEIDWRVSQAGGGQALRKLLGHRDEDAAAAAKAKAEGAKLRRRW